MLTNEQKNTLLKTLIGDLELPDSAYEKAIKRYEDLGEWFNRDSSVVAGNEPHIFSQGSFRLGTAIRPLDEKEGYDIDLACKFTTGISRQDTTQEKFKETVGNELEEYRKARRIQKKLEEKRSCWRLEYLDELNFHMDIVPCIPADSMKQDRVFESMKSFGMEEHLSREVASKTVFITDREDKSMTYSIISPEWHISNPEGYAQWFESRMRNSLSRIRMDEKAQVDSVPMFKRKTILQRVIQILKRHRDEWSKDYPDSKPISIIITTLAAKAYNGEQDLSVALENVLKNMGSLVNRTQPRVPNPVNPKEDFADKWYDPQYQELQLEVNFFNWLRAVRTDFQSLFGQKDVKIIGTLAKSKFAVRLNESELRTNLGISGVFSPKAHTLDSKTASKPWLAV